ncbi:MAG: hypothetical protein LW703_07330 [Rhodobacter sp.]|nr:hypothetical protein [Rhodobacter sp.]
MAESASSSSTYLLVPIVLIALLLGTAVIRGPNLVSLSGFGSAIIVAAPLILATYALMALAVAGRGTVDLAIGPLVAFINVSVVKLNMLGVISGPFGTFFVALGLGVLYQLAFALIVIWVRVQPIIVALSGFLALTGINLVILPRPGGMAPEFMSSWGLGTTIFSPVLLILVIATGGWLLFTLTPLTLTAVTALVLGGVSLAGGRGGVTGALLGALNLWLIGYVLATFNFGAIQAFVTQMSYGIILVLSLLLTLLVPVLSRHISFISPWSAFVVLGAVVVAIMLHVATKGTYLPTEAVAGAAQGPLMERYFLTRPAGGAGAGPALSPIQQMAFLAALAAVVLTFTARLTQAEAPARRMGLFLYLFIAALILALFAVIAMQGEPTSLSAGMP